MDKTTEVKNKTGGKGEIIDTETKIDGTIVVSTKPIVNADEIARRTKMNVALQARIDENLAVIDKLK